MSTQAHLSPPVLLEQPTSEPKNLSDLIIDCLNQLGVEYLFGVPGGHISALYEALERSEKQGGVRAILTAHEGGAAFMADGYARVTGKLGVCCATTGPGATNMLTAVSAAYADYVPLLVITAQTMLSHFNWGAFQESSPDTGIDTLGMFSHCTRYNTLVTHANQLERKLFTAVSTALRAPQGPVHISIPVDVSRYPAPKNVIAPKITSTLIQANDLIDFSAFEQLAHLIIQTRQQGRKIVLLIGQSCHKASLELQTFAELCGADMLSTQTGKMWINPYHPLYKGVFGFAGHAATRSIVSDEKVGLILAVGTSLSQWSTANWDKVLMNDKLVHIHPNNECFSRSPMARLHVQAHVKGLFSRLNTRLTTETGHKPLSVLPSLPKPAQITVLKQELYTDTTEINPARLIYRLQQAAPLNTHFFIDTGNWLAWAAHYLFPVQAEHFWISIGTAAMGWGIGAAIGAAFANRHVAHICLIGDGSCLMNGQDLAIAAAHQLPVIVIVLNDRCYGMIKHRHRQVSAQAVPFDLPPVDFSLIAQGMGAKGYKIRCAADFETFDFAKIIAAKETTLIDVDISSDIVPPLEVA